MTRNRDPRPILVSWSTGKDSALALARLLDDPRVVVTGLLTTVTSGHDRVSIHGVRRSLLHQQAGQLGLELCEIEVRPNSPNDAVPGLEARDLRKPDGGRGFEVCVYVDDVDRTVEGLRVEGVPVTIEPHDRAWGERVAYVADPDGNTVMLTAAAP